MAGPRPLNYSMQPHLDGKKVQVPPLSRGFEPPPGNRFETPPGNRLQPLPSGSMPLPSASLCVDQQAPSSGLLQLPLPRDVLRQPPREQVLQHPTPRNMFQQPPSSNVQLQPSINVHHPPPQNMFQQPPPINMQQPPPINMGQPPPINLRQPPPINMQLPPPRNMFQPSATNVQLPPPINMRQPPPTHMRQPPPTNLRQPPPTNIPNYSGNILQHPHPESTLKLPGMSELPPGLLYPPPCTLTSSQPSLQLPAPQVSALPYTPLAGTAPQFGNVPFPPPRPTLHRGKCMPNSSATPAAFLSERRVSFNSADRPPVCKPLPAGGISSDFATPEVFPSSTLFGKSVEITGSENPMSEISHPFINTSSFGVPPSLATANIDSSVSAANACAILPFVSMPPPIPSLHEVLLSSSVDEKPAHNLTLPVSAIEIPRHPLNTNWISSTKLQSNVDEWLSKKLNSESQDASLDQGDASSNHGHNFPEAQNSVLNYQELEELKKILQESDFHDNERELLSSTLSLLCKQYQNFGLRDVHTCVAAYTLLLERLRGCVVPTAAVRKLLDPIKCILSDQKFQELVKKLVSARTKQRQRKKQRRRFLRQEWERKGKLIDAQREQLQRLEREKIQESKLRAEADAVLKEVRGKQEEAESLQSLLWTLKDLRQHRLNRGEQQGYVSSQRDDDCFSRVTDGLEKMIETQLSDYALEERTLQAMLQSCHPPAATSQVCRVAMLQSCHPPAATSQSETADPDTLLSAVTEALFGAAPPGDDALYASFCAADTSLEMLIARRRAWDEHIVHHNTDNSSLASSAPCGEASGVPVCWVLPPHTPTPPWRQYLASSK